MSCNANPHTGTLSSVTTELASQHTAAVKASAQPEGGPALGHTGTCQSAMRSDKQTPGEDQNTWRRCNWGPGSQQDI